MILVQGVSLQKFTFACYSYTYNASHQGLISKSVYLELISELYTKRRTGTKFFL